MKYEDIGVDSLSMKDVIGTRLSNKDTRSKILDESARLMMFATNVTNMDEDPIPDALHYLGIMHEYGLISVDDFMFGDQGRNENKNQLKLAADLYNRAVQLGYAESMYHLALMYTYGRGVPINYAKAADLLRQAALDHYHSASMRYLALMAIKGYLSEQNEIDYDMAQYWFRQCIKWSEVSSSGNQPETLRSVGQVCTVELKELTDLLIKANRYQIDLLRNLTTESIDTVDNYFI
jgi:hypothetical protein